MFFSGHGVDLFRFGISIVQCLGVYFFPNRLYRQYAGCFKNYPNTVSALLAQALATVCMHVD